MQRTKQKQTHNKSNFLLLLHLVLFIFSRYYYCHCHAKSKIIIIKKKKLKSNRFDVVCCWFIFVWTWRLFSNFGGTVLEHLMVEGKQEMITNKNLLLVWITLKFYILYFTGRMNWSMNSVRLQFYQVCKIDGKLVWYFIGLLH